MAFKILIVEDEPLIALDIKRRLLRLNYQVVAIADSATTALEAAVQFQPDLVLMDIQLKGSVNGIQAAAQLRTQASIPIVFLTAHADEMTLEQAKATQPFGYIVKPFENHALSTTIEIALSRFQAELVTQQALEREKELHELKASFVSVVSHEFRNPLAVIQFALDMLTHKEGLITPEKKQLYIERARDSVQQMKDLLEDVLIIGESDAGKLQCHPTLIDLDYFCRHLIEDFKMGIGANHSVVFTLEILNDSLQALYYLDSKLLRYILVNLLSNAVKYSPDKPEVKFTVFCYSNEVIFQIQDQGIGIPVAEQAQLFSPFYRSSNTKQIPGTGLGLSIVKQCIDAHGGMICIESEEGRGTMMTVRFHQ